MFSSFVTLIGFSSGQDIFQMPRRTQSPNVVCHLTLMNRLAIFMLLFILSIVCFSCSTTKSRASSKKSEPIFIIHNYGKLHEPISLNYFGLSNIDKIATGCDNKRLKRCITVYMKDNSQLVSFKTFLKLNGLKPMRKHASPVYLDTTFVMRPKKLIFVANQKFEFDSVYLSKDSNSAPTLYLRISPAN